MPESNAPEHISAAFHRENVAFAGAEDEFTRIAAAGPRGALVLAAGFRASAPRVHGGQPRHRNRKGWVGDGAHACATIFVRAVLHRRARRNNCAGFSLAFAAWLRSSR
jgi:hypothetical protein